VVLDLKGKQGAKTTAPVNLFMMIIPGCIHVIDIGMAGMVEVLSFTRLQFPMLVFLLETTNKNAYYIGWGCLRGGLQRAI